MGGTQLIDQLQLTIQFYMSLKEFRVILDLISADYTDEGTSDLETKVLQLIIIHLFIKLFLGYLDEQLDQVFSGDTAGRPLQTQYNTIHAYNG